MKLHSKIRVALVIVDTDHTQPNLCPPILSIPTKHFNSLPSQICHMGMLSIIDIKQLHKSVWWAGCQTDAIEIHLCIMLKKKIRKSNNKTFNSLLDRYDFSLLNGTIWYLNEWKWIISLQTSHTITYKIVRSNTDVHKSHYFPKLSYKHQLTSLLISPNIFIVNDNLGPM